MIRITKKMDMIISTTIKANHPKRQTRNHLEIGEIKYNVYNHIESTFLTPCSKNMMNLLICMGILIENVFEAVYAIVSLVLYVDTT